MFALQPLVRAPAPLLVVDLTRGPGESEDSSAPSPATSSSPAATVDKVDPAMVAIDVLGGDSLQGALPATPVTPSSTSPDKRPWHKRLGDQLWFELNAFGAIVYSLFQPAAPGHHYVIFSPVMTAVLCCVFCMVTAYFPYSLVLKAAQTCASQPAAAYAACVAQSISTTSSGPAYMLGWLRNTDDSHRAYDLSFAYMNGWGALQAGLVAQRQAWRLLTSQLLHWSITHLVGNLVVLLGLGVPLERRFGWWRVALAWMLAVLGGGLLSLRYEDPCDQVVGASGGVFGLVGLFAADLILNRHHLKMPIFHLSMTLIFMMIFGVTVLTSGGNVSNYSHLGGLLCGMLPGLAYLPLANARRDVVQVVLRVLGLLFTVLWFSLVPWSVWHHVLPNIVCKAR